MVKASHGGPTASMLLMVRLLLLTIVLLLLPADLRRYPHLEGVLNWIGVHCTLNWGIKVLVIDYVLGSINKVIINSLEDFIQRTYITERGNRRTFIVVIS